MFYCIVNTTVCSQHIIRRTTIFVIMFHITVLVITIASCATLRCAASPVTTETSRDLIVPELEALKDEPSQAEPLRPKELEELGSLIHAVKTQFKGVIEEIVLQTFNYFKSTFVHLKLKLLKKLGKYTLSDVFHATFDGVADFVIDSADESLFDIIDEEPPKPSYGYAQLSDPYFLR